jgi:hypothetical protein
MPKATHKTHASAVYVRVDGKKRAVRIVRPTIRKINVTLRGIKRGLRNAQRALRSKDAGVQMQAREVMAALYKQRAGIDQHFKTLAA